MDSSINFIDVAALTQDEKNAQLSNAAKAGDVEKVGVLLQAGANIEATDHFRETALMWAAMNGHTAVVVQLIAASANIEATNQFGNTALHFVAQKGQTAVVAQLIEAKANIEATNQFGRTALYSATRENHQNAAFLILRAMSPKSRAAVKFGQGGCALNRRLAANPVAGLPLGMRQWLQVLKGRYVKCTNFSVIHLGLWWMLFL